MRPRLVRLGLPIFSLLVVWLTGLLWFANSIVRDPPTPDNEEFERTTDVIVVLTGGSERLDVGLALLAAGRAPRLFISGVHPGIDLHELLRMSHRKPGLANEPSDDSIVLGYNADSTMGNATETAAWMRAQHYHSLRLVTANYHLRRSLLEFHMAMPEVEIIPHPVVPSNVRLSDWWLWRGTTSLIVTEYSKYLAAYARYLLFKTLLGIIG